MKYLRTVLAGLGFLVAAAASGLAQEQDREALKKKILEEVERRLRQEEERLLKDIEKVIEEELSGTRKAPAGESKPPAPSRKVRGYLGIRPGDLSEEEKKDLGIRNGIRIFEVIEGGPAAKAGLKADDILIAIDGKPIDSPQEIPALIQGLGEGARIKVEYLRAGRRGTAEVTLGRHPMDAPQAESAPKKEESRPAQPPREPSRKEEPRKEELRERVKKFLEPREGEQKPPQEEPRNPKNRKAPAEDGGLDFFALDDEIFEQLRAVFEQLGMDPEQFFEQGNDGKWRLNRDLREMFRGFNLDKFRDLLPGGKESPAPRAKPPAPKPEPRKEAPAPPPAPRAWLGVQPEELSEQLRAQLEIEEGVGLLVAEVVPGSPAERAGFRKNDILLKIDGQPVRGEESLAKFMEGAKPGQEASFTIMRRGKEQALKVKLGERKGE